MNHSAIRVVFMGTADFAVPSLQALVSAGYDVCLVVTRPDKPSGRGLTVTETPVAAAAALLGIDVFKPTGLRDPAVQARLSACAADFFVVAAYGRILPPAVLSMPRLGCVNVHGSLLPRYRGAAPIQWSVINGDAETGVTIMMMDEGCDTGPILLSGKTPVRDEDTAATLFERLAGMGPGLLLEALDGLAAGTLVPVAQDHSQATVAPIMDKDVGRIDWSRTSGQISCLVRGVEPWPGAFTVTSSGIRVRVFPFLKRIEAAAMAPDWHGQRPGTVLAAGGRYGDSMIVRTSDGAVAIDSVQPSGARRMTPAAMVAGRRLHAGEVLGQTSGGRDE
ncbi:MAG TPA: methionyl-tRNA formyltransferase [Myxococcota bacterium]|nr:methionyl-tRNA formyltransferase [Myxococcota bacterium]HOD08023.1 methionyl-tRNA formyltransferase [Myxococcota bacterium]HPB50338.1 methionyl-tRNA formyltransferase [Myxococcota bacterium]HQP95420.1 methionyl-tRNA formyltransferase [Myxococcota bacterium]